MSERAPSGPADDPSRLPDLGELLRPHLERCPEALRPRVLAMLERAAAARYRAWADAADPERAEGLRACAAREEEIAAKAEVLFARRGQGAGLAPILKELARVALSTFEGRPLEDQLAIQAAAERRGARVWRGLAKGHPDASAREVLEDCARLEEASAEFLEGEIQRGS